MLHHRNKDVEIDFPDKNWNKAGKAIKNQTVEHESLLVWVSLRKNGLHGSCDNGGERKTRV